MRPMTPTVGDLPVGAGWAFEVAWSGERATVEISDGTLSVRDAAGRDVTAHYPELAALADGVDDVVLDGEILGVDGQSVDPGPDRAVPAVFLVVDLLRLYGVDVTGRPFRQRRQTLERLAGHHPSWTVPPAFDDAAATLAAARQHGLRGVLAKRLESPYRAGTTSPDWVLCRLPVRAGT
jgi:bifunctional non-homologous end joining protein LigD